MATNNSINSPLVMLVPRGGTGAATFTANSILLGNGTGALTALGAATNGQLPIGNTTNPPTLATITGSTGITVTNGAGSITLSTSTGGLAWTTVTGTTQQMAVNNGYVTNNAGVVTLTLPLAAAVGDIVRVDGLNAGGWLIVENAGQIIHFGIVDTTVTTGSLASTAQYDNISLRCIVATTGWTVESVQGNITVV